MFYRLDVSGNAIIFDESGENVTRLDLDEFPLIWPVYSDVSAYYEHPAGLLLTVNDAERIGIHNEE